MLMHLSCEMISLDIYELFKSKGELRYHSHFEQGLNLIMDDKLIFISESQVPFGITLFQNTFKYLRFVNENTVIKKMEFAILFDGFLLDLSKARLTDYTLKLMHTDLDTIWFLNQFLAHISIETGLELPLNQIRNQKEILPIYSKEYDSVIAYLYGRGKGLTPSGDDILIGILSCLQYFDALDPDYLRALSEVDRKRSTQITEAYLFYAMHKKYSRILQEFLYATKSLDAYVLEEAYEAVLKYGHTSGRDTLAGMLIGTEICLKERRVL